MPIVLALFSTVSAFVAVLLLGIPIANLFAKGRRLRAYAPIDSHHSLPSRAGPPAFEPLEMEAFEMSWPSEIPRRHTGLPLPPWPSETWDDEYFGAQAKIDLAKMRTSIEKSEARTRQGRADLRDITTPDDSHAPVSSGLVVEAAAAEVERDFFHEQAPVAPKKHKKKKKPKAQKPKPQAPQGFQEPTAAEVAMLVKEHGLAGAVEKIRGETGWDFRRAAQYLATVLRENQ